VQNLQFVGNGSVFMGVKEVKRQLGIQNEPTVIYCRRESVKAGAVHGPVIRDVCVVECNLSGKGTITINGQKFTFGPRDCYVLLPGDTVVQTSDPKDPRSGVYCILDGLELTRHFHEAGINSQNPFVPGELFGEILRWMEQMLEDVGKKDAGAPMRQASRIYGMLGAMLRGKSTSKGDDLVKKAVGLMESNYHEALSMDSLAANVGLERSYFSVLFQERVGTSPSEYLINLRLTKAAELMRVYGERPTTAAMSVGYEDLYHFSKIFKKHFGISPREYRKREQEKLEKEGNGL
jgi:AraC-like DNA-binding protein